MSTKILNQSQAEAVYSAMCALNNVGGIVAVDLEGGDLRVQQHHTSGKVCVTHFRAAPRRPDFESYADQSAFATAYNLQQG